MSGSFHEWSKDKIVEDCKHRTIAPNPGGVVLQLGYSTSETNSFALHTGPTIYQTRRGRVEGSRVTVPFNMLPFEHATANLLSNIMDFRGFDSSNMLILRGGILMSIGDFPEIMGQRISVAINLVGRLGVS